MLIAKTARIPLFLLFIFFGLTAWAAAARLLTLALAPFILSFAFLQQPPCHLDVYMMLLRNL